MIKLEIKNSDGSFYWNQFHNTLEEAQAWYNEEQTREYWDESRTVDYIEIIHIKSGDEKWNDLRSKRNQLISATDWTLLSDSPFNPEKKAQYAIYRQALRDLPENTSNIDNPPWPVKPS